jgi:hypothetical protein
MGQATSRSARVVGDWRTNSRFRGVGDAPELLPTQRLHDLGRQDDFSLFQNLNDQAHASSFRFRLLLTTARSAALVFSDMLARSTRLVFSGGLI